MQKTSAINTTQPPLILIVEDNLQNLQILAKNLEIADYDIALATDGKDALRALEKILPDLILLDIEMPNINGLELCAILKNNPNLKDIPVILLTAHFDLDDIEKGYKNGAVDYIHKPFSTIELLTKVKTHITIKQERDQLYEFNSIKELLTCLQPAQSSSQPLPVKDHINNLLIQLTSPLKKKKINISQNIPSTAKVYSDHKAFLTLLNNIFLSCIDNVKSNTTLTINCIEQNKFIEIILKSDSNVKGSNLSDFNNSRISLCIKLAQNLNGTIHFNNPTDFLLSITLPTNTSLDYTSSSLEASSST